MIAILPGVQTGHSNFSLDRDGVELAGLDFGGRGTPVLLLHGLAGYAGEWRMTADWLAGQRRVVALDGRGHGRSERRPDDVSIAAHADDAALAIEELELEPAIVVGQSLGGLTAISLAADRPELVKAMASSTPTRRRARTTPSARSTRGCARWPVPFESVLAAAHYFGGSPGSAAAWANGLERREDGWWPRFDFDVMGETLSEALARSYWDEWERIRSPGADRPRGRRRRRPSDRRGDDQPPRQLAAIEVPGAGHDLHLDSPDEWRAVLTGFLEAVDPTEA